MSELSQLKCVPIRGGEPVLSSGEVYRLQPQISDWQVKEVGGEQRLERAFKFKDFAQALAFTDKIGALAEQEDHHPLIVLEWGKVTVNWWTPARCLSKASSFVFFPPAFSNLLTVPEFTERVIE